MASKPLVRYLQREQQGRTGQKNSYGTFLPFYILDDWTLRQLLPPEEKRTDVFQCPAPSPESEIESDLLKEEEARARRAVKRTDSAFGDEIVLRGDERKNEFLANCSVQFERLFQFVEEHLDRVKMEFAQVSEKPPPVDINGDPEKGYPEDDEDDRKLMDSASFLGDSGIQDDYIRIASPRRFLQRLRSVLENLLQSLQRTMSSLDELLGMYDERTQTSEGADLAKKQLSKQNRYEKQLREGMDMIDTELQRLDKEEASGAMSEQAILALAKKQHFSGRHWLMFFLLVATASAVAYFAITNTHSRWTVFLRLVRSPLFVAYYCFLVGFNIMSWARTDINYIRIFEFPSRGRPTPKLLFNIASLFTLIFSVLIFLFLFLSDYVFYIADKVVAIIMWSVLLLFLINPSKTFLRRGRFSFVMVQVRILISPFVEVLFSDVWFADQLNSLVALIVDVQYFLCYCICSPWTANNSARPDLTDCTTSSTGIRPILFCLPALWRFLQCLRSFYDTRKVGHLINAGKYSTTFFVVISAAVYSTTLQPTGKYVVNFSMLDWSGWLIVSVMCFSALLNALYCFAWDVLQDWHLCHCSEQCPRSRLFYRKGWYFLAIIFDFIVRFGNALKLVLGVAYYMDSDLFFTVLVLAEMTRRFVWNFFRVEWEQVNSHYRLARTLES